MKNFITLFISILIFCFSSCSSNDDNNNKTSTSLEGNWLLQNIPTGAKLKFEGSNFTIKSGTVTIIGTFKLINNQMNGQVVSREGANNGGLQPDSFTGKVEISNNRATFTDFDGNWRAVFSTWYGKQ